jgi:hypothetical protein
VSKNTPVIVDKAFFHIASVSKLFARLDENVNHYLTLLQRKDNFPEPAIRLNILHSDLETTKGICSRLPLIACTSFVIMFRKASGLSNLLRWFRALKPITIQHVIDVQDKSTINYHTLELNVDVSK